MKPPFFSIVIPVFNPSIEFLDVLEKVYAQSYSSFEVIICDDGSENDVPALMGKYIANSNISYIRQKNSGPAAARRYGASQSKGKYTVFLDADDYPSETWLEDFKRKIDEGHELVCCNVISYTLKRPIREIQLSEGAVKFNYLAGAFAVSKSLYSEIGGYDKNLRYGENWELGFRLVSFVTKNNLQVGIIDAYNLRYNREMDAQKFHAQSAQRALTCEYLYNKYYGSKDVNSKQLLQWVEMAAVNFSRSGEYEKSRRYLIEAIRLYPRKVKNYVRYVIALFPAISDKFWARKSIQKSFGSKAGGTT